MTAEGRAMTACKIIDGDRCAVCREPISGRSFWHTCGWLFCSEECSRIGSEDAEAHQKRIVAAIREAEAAMKERCIKEVEELVASRRQEGRNPHNPPGFDNGYECACGDIAANIRALD